MSDFTDDETLFVEDLIREDPNISDDDIFSEVDALRGELTAQSQNIPLPQGVEALPKIEPEKPQFSLLERGIRAGAELIGFKPEAKLKTAELGEQARGKVVEKVEPEFTELESIFDDLGFTKEDETGEALRDTARALKAPLEGLLFGKDLVPEDVGFETTTGVVAGTAAELGGTVLNFATLGAIAGAARAGAFGVKSADVASKINQAIQTGGKLRQAVQKGAVAGGVFGAGAGAIEPEESEERIVSAAKGLAKGAAAGAAVGAVAVGAGALIDKFKAFRKGLSGITPQVESILKELPDATKVKKFVGATQARAQNIRNPSTEEVAAQGVNKAGNIIKNKLSLVGKQIGEIKEKIAGKAIGQVDDVITRFQTDINKRFGLELKRTLKEAEGLPKGKLFEFTKPIKDKFKESIKPIKDRLRDVSPADQKRLLDIFKNLNNLKKKPNVGGASDVIKNLDDLVDFSKIDQFGVNRDPLKGLLASLRGQINEKVRSSSSQLAKVNDQFSKLKELESFLAEQAGKDLQRGELLLKRVFSGDKSREAVKLLNQIKEETGLDLVQDAALARFAIEQFGTEAEKSLLSQALQFGARGKTGLIEKGVEAAIKGVTRVKPEKLAEKIITGKEAAKGVVRRGTKAITEAAAVKAATE